MHAVERGEPASPFRVFGQIDGAGGDTESVGTQVGLGFGQFLQVDDAGRWCLVQGEHRSEKGLDVGRDAIERAREVVGPPGECAEPFPHEHVDPSPVLYRVTFQGDAAVHEGLGDAVHQPGQPAALPASGGAGVGAGDGGRPAADAYTDPFGLGVEGLGGDPG
ncbi:hypothetical protein ACWCQJ_18405 [Streptomyces olivaceus]